MKNMLVEAENMVKIFFRAYLTDGDAATMASCLADEVEWFGCGEAKITLGKDAVISHLCNKINSNRFQLSFRRMGGQALSGALVSLLMLSEVKAPERKNSSIEILSSLVCRCDEKGCKIITSYSTMHSLAYPYADSYSSLREVFEDAEKQIRARSFDLLGKSIPGGIMGGYLEKDFPLYYVNKQILDYLGYTYEEFVSAIDGKVINCMHPDDRDRVDRTVDEAFSQNREYEVRYRMQKKDGSFIWVNDIGKKSFAEDGRPVCLSVVRDISAEMQASDKIIKEAQEKEKQANRYNHLFQSVLCGIVQYRSLPDGKVIFKDANQEAIRIFGYSEREFWEKDDWFLPDLVAEEDQEYLLGLAKSMGGVGSKRDYEYRLRQKDGNPCWIIGSAEIILDMDGDILIQSVFLDIDNSKKAEIHNQMLSEQVEAGNILLRLALKHTNSYEFYYYPQEHLCKIPRRTAEHYLCDEEYTDMPESFALAFISEKTRKPYYEMYDKIHRGEKTATAEFESKFNGAWCRVTLSVISYNEQGHPSFVVGIVEDITNEKVMALQLEDARSRDSLTGLLAKDAGLSKVRKYLARKDPSQVCVLMLLDLDNFEEINASEGSVFADAVLQDVAGILRSEMGMDDIVARLGGDEFLLFIKGIGKAQATVLGPRIAKRVQALYSGKEQKVTVSISIGMCSTEVVNEYSGLYRCTESALLYVKENCRGTAACYLDTSNELGSALTQIYTNEHLFNDIDNPSTVRSENMVDFALDLLGRSKKLDDALFLLLARIGNRLGLDRVSILEFDPEYLCFRYSHQWAKDRKDLQMGQAFYLTREECNALPRLYNDEGLCEQNINPGSLMSTCLHSVIWDQGAYAGSLTFESKSADFLWNQEHRSLLVEMTKLISSFILKARSDAVSRAKTDFLSRMSHEIRTPMNAISGMTTIAKSALGNQEKLLDCLNKIESANGYLTSLINDILDMSRIESGKLELNIENADLSELLCNLHDLMASQAEEKKISLVFINHYCSNCFLLLDELRINQILINIIGNAIKFTNQGSVTVAVEPVSENKGMVFLRFSVRDTGIGIRQEALGRIFNLFEQSDKETAAQYGGTGLGLAISSRLVQMMGGTLEVESEFGKGTMFYFTLPLPFGETPVKEKESAVASPVSDNFKGKRILVAEDNELNSEIAVSILQMHSFTVETASDGLEAVRRFTSHSAGYYDAILMDIRMPRMDGLEATKRIRTAGRKDSRTIPIIAMTANAFDEDSKKSLDSGMNGHLTKPLVVQDLFTLLQRCFEEEK